MDTTARPRQLLEDQQLTSDVSNEDLTQRHLNRFYALDRTFSKVSFKQCVITNCYFRKCRFIECDFTGAIIKDSNFRGASFEGCSFAYATIEKTQIDQDVLHRCLPTGENLARDFVRSLRVNFSQIGDYESVNQAIKLEITMTRAHHFSAAYSKTSYYRMKYKSLARLKHAAIHLKWKVLHLIWGNGESFLRVIAISVAAILAASFWHPYAYTVLGYFYATLYVLANFWGVKTPADLDVIPYTFITICRFVLFALFMAVLIKRWTRR